MNTAEFMAALKTVGQDHQLVLDKVQALQEVVGGLFDPADRSLRQALQRLRTLNDYFATQFAIHLEEEELTLFPILERYRPGGPELVKQLRQDHDEIRRKCEELGNCLKVAEEVEDDLPRMVLRDLLAYGWELWEALDRHAHTETSALQKCIAQTLLADAAP